MVITERLTNVKTLFSTADSLIPITRKTGEAFRVALDSYFVSECFTGDRQAETHGEKIRIGCECSRM